MRFLSTATVYLICTAGLAQAPPAPGPLPLPSGLAASSPSVQGNQVTESSSIRAFNVGPDGQVRSLYLRNGSVVDLGASFDPGLASLIHKGARVRVGGMRSMLNGQSIIQPQVVTVYGQSFVTRAPQGPAGPQTTSRNPDGPGGPPPPPPPGPNRPAQEGEPGSADPGPPPLPPRSGAMPQPRPGIDPQPAPGILPPPPQF